MKLYGDVPPEHLELARQLEELERWFNEYWEMVPPPQAAKGMTCIAHDYYSIELEEEGERLLRRAEESYPGYFKREIYTHMAEDDDFHHLVGKLKNSLGLDTMRCLGFGR